MRKKKIIIALLIIIIIELIGIFITAFIRMNSRKYFVSEPSIKENLKDVIQQEKKEDDNFTDEYKQYLDLSDQEKEDLEVIPRKDKVDIDELDNIIDEQPDIEIPSYFNLNDVISINVENQGEYGLCWAFASLKTLETYLELHNGQDYNLSEIKLDYITSNLLYGNRLIHSGGSYDTFEEYLLRTGPKNQDIDEYHDYSEDNYKNFVNEIDLARVTETINFPSLKKDSASFDEIEKFRKTVKTHLMENGAIYTTISSLSGSNHYCDDSCLPSHAVAIVGWDDNYKKENFISNSGNYPKHDGAYIAVNSWGKEWGDNGFLYISYEDWNVENEMSGITSTSMDRTQSISNISSQKIRNVIDASYGYSYIDNKLTNLAIKRITNLDLHGKDLNSDDVKSLNIFSNLNYLNLSDNNIKNIDDLDLMKLVFLDVSNNSIKDVSNINLEKLRSINLSNNYVSLIDGLKNVETLQLENCNIHEVDVSKFKNLLFLDLSGNQLDKLILKDYLESVDLSNSNISSLIDIKGLKSVGYLDLSYNSIENLYGIENIESITGLNLSYNKINNLDGIDGKGLNLIDLSNNEISNIEFINDINIKNVMLRENNIKDITKLKNSNIEYIDLSKNPGISDYSSLKDIKSIVLEENDIKNAELLEALTNAEFLDLSNNDIGNLTPLNHLLNLKILIIDGNENISGILDNNIESLSIKDCKLNDFDISKLIRIRSIDVSDNFIDIIKLLQSKQDDFYVSGENVFLTQQQLEYLVNEKEVLNNRHIYFSLYKPVINIDIEIPYDLSNLKWLKLNSNSEIQNGFIKDGLLDVIDDSNEIILNLNNQIEYFIFNPIIKFNVK